METSGRRPTKRSPRAGRPWSKPRSNSATGFPRSAPPAQPGAHQAGRFVVQVRPAGKCCGETRSPADQTTLSDVHAALTANSMRVSTRPNRSAKRTGLPRCHRRVCGMLSILWRHLADNPPSRTRRMAEKRDHGEIGPPLAPTKRGRGRLTWVEGQLADRNQIVARTARSLSRIAPEWPFQLACVFELGRALPSWRSDSPFSPGLSRPRHGNLRGWVPAQGQGADAGGGGGVRSWRVATGQQSRPSQQQKHQTSSLACSRRNDRLPVRLA